MLRLTILPLLQFGICCSPFLAKHLLIGNVIYTYLLIWFFSLDVCINPDVLVQLHMLMC